MGRAGRALFDALGGRHDHDPLPQRLLRRRADLERHLPRAGGDDPADDWRDWACPTTRGMADLFADLDTESQIRHR